MPGREHGRYDVGPRRRHGSHPSASAVFRWGFDWSSDRGFAVCEVAMSDPFMEQAKVLAAVSAENALLRERAGRQVENLLGIIETVQREKDDLRAIADSRQRTIEFLERELQELRR